MQRTGGLTLNSAGTQSGNTLIVNSSNPRSMVKPGGGEQHFQEKQLQRFSALRVGSSLRYSFLLEKRDFLFSFQKLAIQIFSDQAMAQGVRVFIPVGNDEGIGILSVISIG